MAPRKGEAKAKSQQLLQAAVQDTAAPDAEPAVKQDQQQPQVKLERIPTGDAQRMLQSLKRQAADGDAGPLQAYKKLSTQEGKRNFFWNEFKLDKKCSKFSIKEIKSVSHEEATESVPDWYTADQVAEFEGYRAHQPNYDELKAAAVANLPSKPHPKPPLAALGQCLYWYVHVTIKNTDRQKRQLEGVQAAADVSAVDYELAMKAVQDEHSLALPSSSSTKPNKAVEVETWKAKALQAVKKAKELGNSVSRVMNQAQEALAKLEMVADHSSASSETTKALARSLLDDLTPKVQLVR